MTCGMTPKIDLLDPPGAGRPDALDRAADRSPRRPRRTAWRTRRVLWTNSAITPANGPSPTATTNISANTISLMARQASIRRRTGCTTHCGQMFAEDRIANGMPKTDRERRAPDRDLDRDDHVREIVVPIVEIGMQEGVAELRHVAPVGERARPTRNISAGAPAPGQQPEEDEPQHPARSRRDSGAARGTAMSRGRSRAHSRGACQRLRAPAQGGDLASSNGRAVRHWA